jgi:hypothetical protein
VNFGKLVPRKDFIFSVMAPSPSVSCHLKIAGGCFGLNQTTMAIGIGGHFILVLEYTQCLVYPEEL